ncbi:T6SS effector BTH_I2691 family protein [Pseudomonas sp. NPDC090233]|uniref:T6SS effector BTH_I2691 family protein n=1 Tax=Pseudomonas sp. NPDC090233 TaxID=3364479 RepID=UPI00383AD178
MSISQSIATLVAETDFLLTPCKACQRQGLPILPLRQALVPDTRPGRDSATQTRMGLRTLRSGYLYVLLDQRIWHAYEVTDHGHLRRFNPYEPPPGPPPPLPERCTQADHDLPSSFLNIDTETYGSAWLAFSSDAWPVSVLQAYRNGQAPAHRFEGLDLAQARNNPELLGLAMTPDNLQVDRQVFEYAQQLNGPFDSAHGFHSRFLRKFALRGYVVNAMEQHALENGVLAVVLDDTVGLVQEYNHQRLNWVVKRQAWREDPLRAYQLQTSQILLAIRAVLREQAAQQVPSFEPHSGDGPPVFVDPQVERQRVIEMRQAQSQDRLEERYHEPQRAAFQAQYDQQDAQFQVYIDHYAAAYAALWDSPAFKVSEQYDYDGNNRESGVAYSKTLALCLGGGITEAPSTGAEPRQPAPGTSEALWLKWLQDPHSPPYRALLMRDQALMGAWLPSFSGTDTINWNDSDKLYAVLKQVLTSDEGQLRRRNILRHAVTEMLGAVNAASQRLRHLLPPGVESAVRQLNSAVQFFYNGVQLVALEVRMKLGEYYALQSAHLRAMQHKANEAIAAVRDRIMVSLDDIEWGSTQLTRKVRPIIQNGLLSIAVLDPRFTNTMISVSVWVEGTAEALHERLFKDASVGVSQLSSGAQIALVDLSVAAGTLEPNARKLMQGMRVTSQQAAKLVRTSFAGLRGVAGSWELLLAVGGIYVMNDSLRRNVEKAEVEIGSKSYEAMMALEGARLGVMGGSVEALGLIIRESANQIVKRSSLSAASVGTVKSTVALGHVVVRIGALISVGSSILDSVQTGLALTRTFKSGDTDASKRYLLAGIFSIGAVVASMGAVFNPVLLGPLGVAIVLGMIVYGFNKLAVAQESKPLERWARRCYFGRANEQPKIHWNKPEDTDLAFAELNAATLGLTAELDFHSRAEDPLVTSKMGGLAGHEITRYIRIKITLPRFDEAHSAYSWSLSVHRHGDGVASNFTGGETITSGNYYPPHTKTAVDFLPSKQPIFPDYKPESLNVRVADIKEVVSESESYLHRSILASVEMMPDIGRHNILAATLVVSYWPDRSMPDALAEVIVQECS